MYITETTEKEILQIINKMQNKQSAGIDNIPDSLIKKIAPYIIKPLTYLYNQSLTQGSFPNIFKTAVIKPIHKKGNKQDVMNYRPISLLSGFSKILEKLFYERLKSYLIHCNIITDSQHGFRENRSTETAIFAFINEILMALEKKRNSCWSFP